MEACLLSFLTRMGTFLPLQANLLRVPSYSFVTDKSEKSVLDKSDIVSKTAFPAARGN